MAIQTTQWQHLSALKVDLIFKASIGMKKEGDWSDFLHGEPGELLWLFPNLLISRDFQSRPKKKRDNVQRAAKQLCGGRRLVDVRGQRSEWAT